MFKIASWNVNSLGVRLGQVMDWLAASQIDVLAIQETKVPDEKFPAHAFIEKGYHVVFSGQKTYNGVAIISKQPITGVLMEVPGLDDPQKRILVAQVKGIQIINLYVPNGAELTSDKYRYKLDWLKKVSQFIKQQLSLYSKVVVLGDFNIAPEDRDVHDPVAWQGCVLVSPEERQAFFELLSYGLLDSFRQFEQSENAFSWWDYRAAGFRRNRGLRIDHVLLSKELAGLCLQAQIDKVPRQAARPSDHAPVWVELKL